MPSRLVLRSSRATVLLSLTVSLAACAPRTSREVAEAVDLGERLSLAVVSPERAVLPLALAEGRPYRVSGFSHLEVDRAPARLEAARRSFRWSDAPVSVVRFFLLEPRPLKLVFDCRPHVDSEMGRQAVTLLLNGQEIGVVSLKPGRRRYRYVLPESLLRVGDNRVGFQYRWTRSPMEAGAPRDGRNLGVAWYGLRLKGQIRDAAPVAIDATSGALVVPWGNQVDWFLSVQEGSELRFGDVTLRGRGTATVTIQADQGEERLVAALSDGEAPPTVELGVHGIVRLRLSARAAPQTGDLGGVLLSAPAIWSPVPPAASAPIAGEPSEIPPANSLQGGPAARRPNVLLYVVDTLRADHLGCYGYDRAVSPVLDQLAERSVLFQNVVAQSSWTRASMASVFTGLRPFAHGVNLRSDKLADSVVTLAERLQQGGYHTAAVVGNGNVSEAFGFAQGFDFFKGVGQRPDSDRIHQEVFSWLADRPRDRPFFLWVQTIDPHDPYDPPDDLRAKFAPGVTVGWARETGKIMGEMRTGSRPVKEEVRQRLVGLYDAEIASNDRELGKLFERFAAAGALEDTVILFTSDHGEEFFEHGGWQHGMTLHGEQVKVPLIVHLPGEADGLRVETPVQHVDLPPTILELAGIEAPVGLPGRSLLGLIAEPRRAEQWRVRPIVSWLQLDQVWDPRLEPNTRAAIQLGEWKLSQILDGKEGDRLELYRWFDDPGELHDLAITRPVLAGYLATRIKEALQRPEQVHEAEEAIIDEELADELRALGYLS